MSKLMMMENPYGYGFDAAPNPRRKKNRRNPAMSLTKPKTWMQGIGVVDIGAAIIGLWAATSIPAMFVTDTSTTGKKLVKVGVSAASAAVAGFILGMARRDAGRAAALGGFAGTAMQALSSFTTYKIIGAGGAPRALGTRFTAAPLGQTTKPEFERSSPSY